MTVKEQILALRVSLQKANENYYKGFESMTNFEYDKAFDELQKLEEQYQNEDWYQALGDSYTKKVGVSVTEKKVVHEFPAKSLDKTKDIEELIGVQNNPSQQMVCLSWKLDGSTVQLTYDHGILQLAGTRGDGFVGQNITKNARFIEGVPQTIRYQGKLVLRGEAIMSYEEFQRLNENGEYANPRNLANATITADREELLQERKVMFRPFELVYQDNIEENISSFSMRLDYLDYLGFQSVSHKRIPVSEMKKEVVNWSEKEVIEALPFPVDGLVVVNDNCIFTQDLVGTEHHPNRMKGMAFKWQDETVKTVLRDIKWQVGRTGVLTPVALFDTVDLVGTKVSKASLHNLSYVEEKDLSLGDTITVYKANMIIPQVAENLSKGILREKNLPLPTSCPCCKRALRKEENNGVKNLFCENKACPEKVLAYYTHFVSKHGMNIEGLSENTLHILLEKGFVSEPADLFRLSRFYDDIAQMEGFGVTSASKLMDSIERAKHTDFEHFLYACGIDGFGRGQSKILKAYLETYESGNPSMEMLCKMAEKGFDFTQINGIGMVLAENLTSFLATLSDAPMRNLLELLDFQEEAPKVKNTTLKGKTFCITGALETFENRDIAFSFIEQNGGKTSTGVSSKTDYLINNDVSSTSGKNKKAKELGIPIITEKELRQMTENVNFIPHTIKKSIERE